MKEAVSSLANDHLLEYYDTNYSPELPEIKIKDPHFLQRLDSFYHELRLQPRSLSSSKDIFWDFLQTLLQNKEPLFQLDRLNDLKSSTRQELLRRIARSDEIMLSNLSEPPSLKEIAAEVEMSPFHFQRQYKKVKKQSPFQFQRVYRLNKACELAQNTSLSLAGISNQLGFADLPAFSKAFKQHFGYNPSSLRSSNN